MTVNITVSIVVCRDEVHYLFPPRSTSFMQRSSTWLGSPRRRLVGLGSLLVVVRCMIDRFVVSSSMILPAAGFQLLRGFLSRMESHARRSPPPIVSACRYVAARVESVLSETNFSHLASQVSQF